MREMNLNQILEEAEMLMNGNAEAITIKQGLEAIDVLTQKKLGEKYSLQEVNMHKQEIKEYFKNINLGDGPAPPYIALSIVYHQKLA